MKKIYFILLGAAVFLSSCLKDKPNTDFSGIGTTVELVEASTNGSGLQYFSSDAVTDAGDTIVKKFYVNVASKSPLSTATNYTIGIDNSLLTAYNTAHPSIAYQTMPTGSYVISKTSGTVAAGGRLDTITVTFYKHLLDPAKSYMAPIALKSASNGILSGNFNALYYHFIGNDFAGSYRQTFRRFNASDSTSVAPNGQSFSGQPATFVPLSPTEFTVKSGYAGYLVSYDINFTKNADGTYSNFSVAILPSDIAVLTANSIALTQNAVFLTPPTQASYTYAQALKLFQFQWIATTSADRYLVDYYYK